MTIEGPHGPTTDCDGCRELFNEPPDDSQGRVISATHWVSYGYHTVVTLLDGGFTPCSWVRSVKQQAMADFTPGGRLYHYAGRFLHR